MKMSREQLWQILQNAGVTQGALPAATELESPWYVRTLLGFSGWLASLFLLGFIGGAFVFVIESNVASISLGGIMIAAAYSVLRLPKNEFFQHLALAVSLAGQMLITKGIVDIVGGSEAGGYALVAVMQTALAIIMPNFVHRVFSSFIASFAFALTLYELKLPFLFSGVVMLLAAWLWLNEFKFPQHLKKVHAIAYGLTLGLISLKGTALYGWWLMHSRANFDQKLWIQPWMGELLATVVLLYVVYALMVRRGFNISHGLTIVTLTCTAVVGVASIKATGISTGIMLMVLGFAASNRVLLGLGITSLLFFISSYYYLQDATLLVKSIRLFSIGVILLVARWVMLRLMPATAEARDE